MGGTVTAVVVAAAMIGWLVFAIREAREVRRMRSAGRPPWLRAPAGDYGGDSADHDATGSCGIDSGPSGDIGGWDGGGAGGDMGGGGGGE